MLALHNQDSPKHAIVATRKIHPIIPYCNILYFNKICVCICINFKVCTFLIPADTWPEVFDDSNARRDWGWKHEYDITGLCEIMFDKLKPVYQETKQKAAI